jgi:DNA-binding transcriptional MerR regulator
VVGPCHLCCQAIGSNLKRAALDFECALSSTVGFMTVTTEALRELVDSHDAADLPAAVVGAGALPGAASGPGDREVAEITGVSAHTLRYYERILLVAVDRDAGGRRIYDSEALARVVFVTRLRTSDMPIRDIARYLALVNQGEASVPTRLALMQAHRTAIPTPPPRSSGRPGRHRLQDRHIWRPLLTLTKATSHSAGSAG